MTVNEFDAFHAGFQNAETILDVLGMRCGLDNALSDALLETYSDTLDRLRTAYYFTLLESETVAKHLNDLQIELSGLVLAGDA
jgi:hypothetical protein